MKHECNHGHYDADECRDGFFEFQDKNFKDAIEHFTAVREMFRAAVYDADDPDLALFMAAKLSAIRRYMLSDKCEEDAELIIAEFESRNEGHH